MLRLLVVPLTVGSLLGAWQVAFAASGSRNQPTVADQVQVTPENGGINPDGFAYRIKARILVGANACDAKGVLVGLVRHQDRKVLELLPTKMLPRGPARICTRDWNPVYRTIELVVRGHSSRTEDVVIENVGKLGTRTSVKDLLEQDSRTTSLTGALTRVMAIGGESGGFALELADGQTIEVDLKTGGFLARAKELVGQKLTVKGTYKTITGPELSRPVLEVTSLDAAE